MRLQPVPMELSSVAIGRMDVGKGKRAVGVQERFRPHLVLGSGGIRVVVVYLMTVRIDAMNSVANPLLVSRGRSAGHWRWLVTPPKQQEPDCRIAVAWDASTLSATQCRLHQVVHVYRVSAPILRREQLGNWIQLGFVWDGVGKTLSQYVNGELVTRDRIATADAGESVMLSLRDMQIGNASATDDRTQHAPGKHLRAV